MDHVGDYTLIKQIGKGSFSKVFKAIDNRTQKKVAIKQIDCTNMKTIVKDRIYQEIELYKRLDHPYIIKMYDVIYDKERENIYIILEYCEGGTLHDYLKRGKLSEGNVLYLFIQLREGLKYLYENKIVHRDLKPQNILLMDCGKTVKIADFGFAKVIQDNVMIETLCGSPLYMAPEIIKRDKYTIKADLWSLGLILYKMVYGRHPYGDAKNLYDLMLKIEGREVLYDPTASRKCKDLMLNLLKIDHEERLSWKGFFNHKWFPKKTESIEISRIDNMCLKSSLSSFISSPLVKIMEDSIPDLCPYENQNNITEVKGLSKYDLRESLSSFLLNSREDIFQFSPANDVPSRLLRKYSDPSPLLKPIAPLIQPPEIDILGIRVIDDYVGKPCSRPRSVMQFTKKRRESSKMIEYMNSSMNYIYQTTQSYFSF
jgi:serine/threonine protein kinase